MTRALDQPSSVIDQASAWAVRMAGEAASVADYLALEAWLAQSPLHAAAFTEAEGLLAALDEDRAALDAAVVRSVPTSLPGLSRGPATKRGGARLWRWAGGGLAAAAAVVAAIAVAPSLLDRPEVFVTAPGEQRTVILADGSTIAMNGASRLSVRLTSGERLVEMGPAEAAFDVARDPERPFRVIVGESRVEVLGTAFAIRRDDATTRVAVSRGVVRVSDLQNPARNVRLTRGQAVARADDDDALHVTAAPQDAAGWRTGRLVYEDRPLSEVIADLNRAYRTPIRAVDGAGDVRFTGVLVLDDQPATVRRLETFVPVVAARTDGAIELRPR